MLFTPVLLGVFVGLELVAYHQSVQWVAHTNVVLSTVDNVLMAVTRAESAQRGFLLSGNASYAAWCSKAQKDAMTAIESLKRLTGDNRSQHENVLDLQIRVDERFQQMNRLIERRTRSNLPPAERSNSLQEGTSLMQQIWDRGRHIIESENQLLRSRATRERETEIRVALSFALCISVTLVLLVWAYRIITAFSLEQTRAREEVLHLNAELEDRVTARTAELEEVNENLRRSNEDLTNFAYVASHDLQEPLRTIGSYVGLLALRYQGKLDEQADKYIQFAVDGAKRMQNLVQDLLIYSRVGTESLKAAPVSMETVLKNVGSSLALLIEEQRAALVSSPLPVLIGDEGKLTRVFMNLIGNAIKFRRPEEPPRVVIDARNLGEYWQFSISDNGIGFDQQYAERIFAIFQRLHGVGVYPGTGMGLAICRRIIEQHGGKIWATSNPGAGSSFIFTLPTDMRRKSLESRTSLQDAKMGERVVSR